MKQIQRIVETLKLDVNLNRSTGEALGELAQKAHILVIPQFAVQGSLYLASSMILPLTTPAMLSDFSACGGLIMLATGFRICGIKQFPVASMIPALVFVMPLSWIWTVCIG